MTYFIHFYTSFQEKSHDTHMALFLLRKICMMASYTISIRTDMIESKEDFIMFSNYNNFNPYQMPQRASQSNLEWIMVQNINQIENVAVSPNSKAWIMVQNEPVFALRTADAMGLTTTECFRFEKYAPDVQKADFVTSAQLQEAIENLRGELHESIVHTGSNRAGNTAKAKQSIESD